MQNVLRSLEQFIQTAGLSSLGVPGVPWHTQILADQLTLFQPGRTDYAQIITTGTPGLSDNPTALKPKVSVTSLCSTTAPDCCTGHSKGNITNKSVQSYSFLLVAAKR